MRRRFLRDRFGPWLPLAIGVAAIATWGAAAAQEDPPPTSPAAPDSGITERTGLTLQLLDVEVLDRQGRPIRGLTREDFVVQIDGRLVEVYSADDLCGCPGPGEPGAVEAGDATRAAAGDATRAAAGDAGPTPATATATSVGAGPGEPVRYVMYFDFSQLQPDGRKAAERTAEDFMVHSLPAGAEAMLAGYHSIAGLVEICPFTTDRSRLISTMRAAFDDPGLVDVFPYGFAERVRSCPLCCASCTVSCSVCCADECVLNARREYEHGRRSYRALSRFLTRLQGVPGPKALILFQQNATNFPDRYYPPLPLPSDHLTLLDEIGAEAVLGRTTVHTAFVGNPLDGNSPDKQAVNVGALLAESTGGSYGRTVLTAGDLVRDVVRECRCIYRIAIVPRGEPDNRVHRVKVWAAGTAVPYRYRVARYDESESWWRSVLAVLEEPAAARDVAVQAAIVPVARNSDGWELTAEVTLDVDTLTLLPTEGGQGGEWEVGALLHRETRAWEMLGLASVRTGQRAPEGASIAHEHVFADLRGGSYRLAAFVRDRTADAFGGGESTLDLPEPGHAGIAGPIARIADQAIWATELPLRRKGEGRPDTRTPAPRRGSIPVGDTIPVGARLSLATWICPETPDPPYALVRYVARGDTPLFRFGAARLDNAGDCFRIDDTVESAALESGDYAYVLRWTQVEGDEPVEARREFRVPGAEPVEVQAEPAREEPEGDPRLPAILDELAKAAARYRDQALRFTCDEVIAYRREDGRRARHAFRYVYTWKDGQLRDYRVPREARDVEPPQRASLDSYDLPAYLVRAYSWAFVFGEELRDHFDFRVVDEDEPSGRSTLAVAFDPKPPFVADVNEWFGTAWIDRDTYRLVRVRAYHVEDRAALERSERPRAGESAGGAPAVWLRYDTDFDVDARGMHFPGRVDIRGFLDIAPGQPAGTPRQLFQVTQRYRDYRFFEVSAEPSIGGAEDPGSQKNQK